MRQSSSPAGRGLAWRYGLTGVTFVTAIYHTSTADLVFILAFNTVFAALLSWLFLRERPRLGTVIAMSAMILGVLIIVGGSVGTGHLFGDFMALCSALFVAIAITISRASGKDMGFTALIGVVLPLAVALYMVSGEGFHVNQPRWIIFNRAVISRSRSSALPMDRNTFQGRRWRCSICSRPRLHRSGCG